MLLLVLFPAGCTPQCEGAGCGALYPAADLNLLVAGSLEGATASPLLPDGVVHGALADGNGWALATDADGVFAGMPERGEARRYGPTAFLDGGAPDWTLDARSAEDRYGAAVARTADGYLVGAPGQSSGAGAVYVYAEDQRLVDQIEGTSPQLQLGTTLAACGDVDGDGGSDWVAGAPWAEDGAALGGEVWIATATGIAIRAGTEAAARFGSSLSCTQALDGDDVAELVIGAPFGGEGGMGVVRLWRGGAGVAEGDPALALLGPEPEAWFGSAITTGDLDGDGAPELIVSAPGRDGGGDPDTAGAVYVYLGTDVAQALNVPEFMGGSLLPAWELHGVYARGRLGDTVAIADLDGDGLGDLVVGAPGMNTTGADGGVQAGAVYVFRGPPSLWSTLRFATTADLTVSAARQYLRSGEGLATPDVDADGRADLVLLNRAADPGDAD